MSEDFILHDTCVICDIDCFDGEGRDFGEEDSAEGICDCGMHADEVEFAVQRIVAVEFYGEGFTEFAKVPGVVFAGPVAGKVGVGDVGDDFGGDADDLYL